MSAFKTRQCHLLVDGRTFHFVAYESQPENRARSQAAEPAMWCLMVGGRRWPVMPFVAGETEDVLQESFSRWIATHATGAVPAT